jgi:hypothetical protein
MHASVYCSINLSPYSFLKNKTKYLSICAQGALLLYSAYNPAIFTGLLVQALIEENI